jgi:hypothetical protein
MVVIIHGGYREIILRGATYTRGFLMDDMTLLIYQEVLLIRLSVQLAGLE